MAIGVIELGAVLLVTVVVVVAVVVFRGKTVWLLLLPVSLLLAAAVTPADPVSFMLYWLLSMLRVPIPA